MSLRKIWTHAVSRSPSSLINAIPRLKGAPQWRNELGKEPVDLEEFRKEITAVALPSQDPVNGADGPLLSLWSK